MYAQAHNIETCAAPGCYQPAEVDLPRNARIGHHHIEVRLGYCINCILHEADTNTPTTPERQPS